MGHFDLHFHQNSPERPLSGNDVIRFAIFVYESSIGLHPFPPVFLGEQSKDSQATFPGLNHCESTFQTCLYCIYLKQKTF